MDCQYNRQRYPQHPEMTINLEQWGRSLWDPIDADKHPSVAQMRKRRLDDMHSKSTSLSFVC